MNPLKIALNIDIRFFFNLNILKSIAFLVHINLNTLAYLGDKLILVYFENILFCKLKKIMKK
jgi:hypothetical protein